MLSRFVLFCLIAPAAVLALTCYENDDQGNVYEVTNSTWTYCALIPSTDGGEGSLFGVGPQIDNVATYDTTFKQSDNVYKILTVCIYEKYDFGRLSPRFQQRPEFLFRCVCNYDRCNSATTFSTYLKGVQKDNLL